MKKSNKKKAGETSYTNRLQEITQRFDELCNNGQPCMSHGYKSQEKRAEMSNRIQRARNQNHKEESIDYGALSGLLDKVIVEAIRAKSECSKELPDMVELCDHAVENLGRLYDEISSCVLSHDLRCVQLNNGVVEININFHQH